MDAGLSIAAVFVGCSGNAIFLELLTRADPGSGILITFAQFLFIAVVGIIFTSKFGRVKRVIPLRNYVILVALFAFANLTNNYALKFDISMPLHMIFRSGSLITNMILGVFILKRQYSFVKFMSVILITLGIIICTIASAEKGTTNLDIINPQLDTSYFKMAIGVVLLSIGLFLSSWLSICQEQLFLKFGKRPSEALFYSHLLPLPGFLMFYNDLRYHANILSTTEIIEIPGTSMFMPELWIYLFGNIITQYLCISSVYVLQTECTSLTVTLVVTLRKFFSILVSIFYFNNPFTIHHWIGTGLVFVGTFMFTGLLNLPSKRSKL